MRAIFWPLYLIDGRHASGHINAVDGVSHASYGGFIDERFYSRKRQVPPDVGFVAYMLAEDISMPISGDYRRRQMPPKTLRRVVCRLTLICFRARGQASI